MLANKKFLVAGLLRDFAIPLSTLAAALIGSATIVWKRNVDAEKKVQIEFDSLRKEFGSSLYVMAKKFNKALEENSKTSIESSIDEMQKKLASNLHDIEAKLDKALGQSK